MEEDDPQTPALTASENSLLLQTVACSSAMRDSFLLPGSFAHAAWQTRGVAQTRVPDRTHQDHVRTVKQLCRRYPHHATLHGRRCCHVRYAGSRPWIDGGWAASWVLDDHCPALRWAHLTCMPCI